MRTSDHACWVSFSIPEKAEGRAFVVIGVPSCMPGIVFDTHESGGVLSLWILTHVCRVSFSIPKRAEEGNALIRGVFLSCDGYRFRYL